MIAILAALVFALSLCADCFAVSACSSVTLREISWRRILAVSLVFAVVQSGLLLAGWSVGDLFVGFVGKVAPVIGFLLLAYVGGSLAYGAWRDTPESHDLNGLRNIFLGAVATSIDAFAAGMSLSMDLDSFGDMLLKFAAVFLVTFLSVILGIKGGSHAGRRYGRAARWVGAVVLIGIGINILVKAFYG